MMLTNIPPLTFAFVAALGGSILNAMLGYLLNVVNLSVFQLIIMRLGADFSVYLTYILVTKQPGALFGPPEVRRLLWLRGTIDAVELPLFNLSMMYLTQSEATSCFCCSPLVTGIMGWVLVGERFNRAQVAACFFSILGVVLIANPFRDMLDSTVSSGHGRTDDHIPTDLKSKLIGFGLALHVLFLSASEIVVMRRIRTKVSTAQVLTVITFCPMAVSAGIMGITRDPFVIPRSTEAWTVIMTLIVFGLMFNFSWNYALQRTTGLKVDSVQYCGIVFSTLVQWAIYGNHPSPLAYLGMAIIAVAGICGLVYGPPESVIMAERVDPDGETAPLLRDDTESEDRD